VNTSAGLPPDILTKANLPKGGDAKPPVLFPRGKIAGLPGDLFKRAQSDPSSTRKAGFLLSGSGLALSLA